MVTKENYNNLTKEEKIGFHRGDVIRENQILKLRTSELIQIELETYGAMSILFHEFTPDPEGVETNVLESAQSTYYEHFVNAGWMPRPLQRFQTADSPAEVFNAAGAMSGAFIEISRVELDLPTELTEL